MNDNQEKIQVIKNQILALPFNNQRMKKIMIALVEESKLHKATSFQPSNPDDGFPEYSYLKFTFLNKYIFKSVCRKGQCVVTYRPKGNKASARPITAEKIEAVIIKT